MTTRVETIANLVSCMDSIDALCTDLTEAEWATASLCPGWDSRGVLGHLASIEHMLVGWMPQSAEDPVPFARAGEFAAETEGLNGPELLARYRDVVGTRKTELDQLTDEQFDRPAMTPVGPQTYGRFMAIRVFDFWVHERDIRVPLGRPGDDGGPAADQALDEIHRSLGYIVGKKIGVPDGMSIAFHLTGPVQRDMYAVVDGRASVVDDLSDPDIAVTTDSLTFTLLACGRIDPQGPIDAGKISWTGPAELGERAARNLGFTM